MGAGVTTGVNNPVSLVRGTFLERLLVNQSEQIFHLLGSLWKEQVPEGAIESRATCPIPRADRV